MNVFTNRNKFSNPKDRVLSGTGLFGLARVYCMWEGHAREIGLSSHFAVVAPRPTEIAKIMISMQFPTQRSSIV